MLLGLLEGVYKSPGTTGIIALIQHPPLLRHHSLARILRRSEKKNNMKVSSTLVRLMALVWLLCVFCDAVAEVAPKGHRRFRNRLPSRSYAAEDFIAEDEDSMEINKRQLFDDYGHMRFGKRDRFDDYGHMRFGRNHE